MDDLIRRQAAKDAFMKATADGDKVDFCWWVLNGVPTIDPVKHGKWFNTSTDIPKLSMNVCSECGFQYPSAIRPRFNFCPNCGSHMEESDGTL